MRADAEARSRLEKPVRPILSSKIAKTLAGAMRKSIP
jgi:hypothetical protein